MVITSNITVSGFLPLESPKEYFHIHTYRRLDSAGVFILKPLESYWVVTALPEMSPTKVPLNPLNLEPERTLGFGIPALDERFRLTYGEFAALYGSPYALPLSFLLSVMAQLPADKGGFDSSVIYVDGGNTFNPYAISSAAQLRGFDPKVALERIFISRAFTAYQLSSLIFDKLKDAVEKYRSKVIIISDITSLFLDPDVPKREAVDIFNHLTMYLANFASEQKTVILTIVLPKFPSRLRTTIQTIILARANVQARLEEVRGGLRFVLEKHPHLKLGYVNLGGIPLGRAATLEEFIEVG